MIVHNTEGRQSKGLLRRLLASPHASTPADTGTSPLSAHGLPGTDIVSSSTLRAIEQLARSQPGWDTRLLIGTQRSLSLAWKSGEPALTLDGRQMLPDSLPELLDGDTALTSDREARQLIEVLDMSPDCTLVYLTPLIAHQTIGGIIVTGVDNALNEHTIDGLQAIAIQSGRLLETAQTAEGLRQREAGIRALVQSSSDILMVVDKNITIVDLAPSAGVSLGYPAEELLGLPLTQVLHPHDVRGVLEDLLQVFRGGRQSRSMQWRLRRSDGSMFHAEVVINNLLDDPEVAGMVLSARDISERKALEAGMLHKVLHDELTGLPNRTAFMRLLENAVERCRSGSHSMAVLFLDLDRFKVVNDSLGHEAGDKLLVQVARRLQESVRPGDIVARLSGDEFVVIIDDINGPEPAVDVAEKILYRLREAIRIDSNEVFVSTSIGIAIENGSTPEANPTTILNHADLAMYATKHRGRSGYSIYHPLMSAKVVDRLALETDLRYAIANGELQVFYQPLINLQSGQVNQVEALVRWMHPTRGLLLPDTFIGMAEETGLIEPIGQWVLEEACRQARLWQQQRPSASPLQLNVNLSVRQFQQRDLVRDIARTLRASHVDPRQITLEITESVALEDAQAAVATMHDLKKIGIKLAIDDFGTGFSALSYLKRFPVDALKIDRSFIEGLNYDDGDMAIVKAVIAFAKTLHLRVTAEGVETPDQLRQLRQLGCDLGQGYYFATPLPGMDLVLDSRYGTGKLTLLGHDDPEPLPTPRIIHHTA